jgi:methylated-DNA-[protein]-cysteine S-methyltransferase
MELYLEELETPVGQVAIVTQGSVVYALDFEDYRDRMDLLLNRYYGTHTLHAAPRESTAFAKLRAYFAGELTAIESVEIAKPGTAFQQKVWAALRAIPLGQTQSYGELAAAIGQPKASRAVGMANGSNPIAIIVPCHRVIGSNAALTGYGGGMHRKEWLLQHEGVVLKARKRRKMAEVAVA